MCWGEIVKFTKSCGSWTVFGGQSTFSVGLGLRNGHSWVSYASKSNLRRWELGASSYAKRTDRYRTIGPPAPVGAALRVDRIANL